MDDKKITKELEYLSARKRLEQEMDQYILYRGEGKSHLEVPSFHFEKGVTKYSFTHNLSAKDIFYDILQIIFNHVERVQMYSFEEGFMEVQDVGPISSPHANLSEGIKFRFISLLSSEKVDIKKLGNFTEDELQACIQLFQLFHPVEKILNPTQRLLALGTQVFLPTEKQLDKTETPKEDPTYKETEAQGNSKIASLQEFTQVTGNGVSGKETKKPNEQENHKEAASDAYHVSHTKSFFTGFVGYKNIREELMETILLPLQHAEIFSKVARQTRGQGASNLPKAVLFQGPSGVGKTTVAKLTSQQSGMPMVYVPIENILSKYYGESAQNLANIFDAASQYRKAIIFIDEIDSLATSREQGLYEATRRVLSVLLRKLDSMESNSGTLMIGATNRMEDLDRALLSRFDTVLRFPLPDANERALIFIHYAQHLDREKLDAIAIASQGLSGRCIEDICEYTERRWTRQLIAEQKPASAPPLDLYLEITKKRQAQLQSWPGPEKTETQPRDKNHSITRGLVIR